jgi:hypothetical protein
MARRLLLGERVNSARHRFRLVPDSVAVLSAFAFAIALPGAARAADGPRVELEGDLGLMFSATVRNVASSAPDTSLQSFYSGSAGLSVGPVLVGANVGAALSWFGGRLETFAGGFIGSELMLDRTLLRAVAEGGLHWVEQPGNDGTYFSTDMPSARLPFVGMRLALEREMIFHKRTLSVGASAYLRADVEHEQVSGTVIRSCAFADFDCENPALPATLDVGGLMVGLGVSVTWGTDR